MLDYILAAIGGVLCILLGIANIKGKLASIHFYHRSRVSEEDAAPFGKLMGAGTIICGVGLIGYGALSLIADFAEIAILATVGDVCLYAGLIIGLPIGFYAMKKYNKGVF